MTTRIVVLTTEGQSREDGNVYYSRYLIVRSASSDLKFEEPIFTDELHKLRTSSDQDGAVDEIKKLGYRVREPKTIYVEFGDDL